MKMGPKNLPLVFCILDGWGCTIGDEYDAIHLADTPCWNGLLKHYPNCRLSASGASVGLPEGQMGNSEVGHMTIGAGRVIEQDLVRIDRAIKDHKIGFEPALQDFIDRLRQQGGACHIMGLLSGGGVHSHCNHIVALARTVADAGLVVYLHAFLDGRDVRPVSAAEYIARFAADAPGIKICTVSGRYYAMDRDYNWDRIKRCYDAIVWGSGARYESPAELLQSSYGLGITDEFVIPAVVGDYAGLAEADGILMANFRADRARQILSALVDQNFSAFEVRPRPAVALGMVQYSNILDRFMPSIFPPQKPVNTLGETISDAGLRQLRIAETEKYAHVTYFFNCGAEGPLPGESRVLVPSPKVATYDLKPEMSAFGITSKLTEAIRAKSFDFIVVNFANADMVGHTGKLEAAIKAVQCIDQCIGKLVPKILQANGTLVISADHGNAEKMFDGKAPCVSHTMSDVPFVVISKNQFILNTLKDGALSDIAPTLLDLINIEIPEDMTGTSLLS
ncbi:2,3-bisphosphoglycerate-independent phosphoglycerate mutase [Rickettsiales bacterium]|nr:2,3-bisphosphoglycerate-independent phosphoglycerate mutase [Rickettsiales bacterium]